MSALSRALLRQPCHRLIASRHPTIGVFDDLASDPGDLRVAFLLESLTNDRLAGMRLGLLPDAELIAGMPGSGASLVMAAFLHADPAGGRFSDGRIGAWYASLDIETAIAETIYHHGRRLRLSDGGFPNRIRMRELNVTLDTALADIRGLQAERPELYRDTDYSLSQAFAAQLRWPADPPPENGIVFDSVRRQPGTNICIFWPSKVPLPVVQGDHFEFQWDSDGSEAVFKLTNVNL